MIAKISVLVAAVAVSANLLGQNGHGIAPNAGMPGQNGHGIAPKQYINKVESEFAGIADKINAGDFGWKAEVPSRFATFDDVKILSGTWLKGHKNYQNLTFPNADALYANLGAIPDTYDARTDNTKNCTEIISKVRDQSSCGSCWAFSATETFEAAKCLALGNTNTEYSAEDTAGCCSGVACGFSQGCNGGQPGSALDWMTKTGVVTGGDYFDIGTPEGLCKPYTLQPCAHHVPPSSKYPACPSQEYSLSCTKKCEPSYTGSYNTDKTKGTKVFSLSSIQSMQQAIMTTGPLSVAFTVYSDFPTYKSGVYKHTSGTELGGHAVVMLGWGVENGTAYWLIKNSWNEQWGDGGYFKIVRGVDECGIEDEVVGITV